MRAVLYVDDQEEELQTLRLQLADRYRVMTCRDGATAVTLVTARKPDAVVLDLEMPGYDGFKVLSDIRALPAPPPILMLSAHPEPFFVVRAMKAGAADFLSKPYTASMVRHRIDRLFVPASESRSLGSLDCPELVGSSRAMREVRDTLAKYARSEAPVLILGESGTGKDLAARTIHALSARARGPFVVRNVGAMPETIAESELFGCEDGAFTDARRRAGCFEAAHGGTLFLDEIADAGPNLQAALLRVVEDGMVLRLGGSVQRRIDCRLVFATNRKLEGAAGCDPIRNDLLFRISTLPVTMPPLRERPEDIPELVARFAGAIDQEAMNLLKSYSWPGNVRQLKACVERAGVLSGGGRIGAEHILF